jgi:hypothetical protein
MIFRPERNTHEDVSSMQLAQNHVLRPYSGNSGIRSSGSATSVCYKITWWVNKFGYLESGLDLIIFSYLVTYFLRRPTSKIHNY